MSQQQTAAAALLVRPASFGFNAETAASNAFQAQSPVPGADVASAALAEADALHAALRSEGIAVSSVADHASAVLPDAVFPNNWLSFHDDGTVVLYPLLAPLRRLERREAIITQACRDLGFVEQRRIDLSAHELAGHYLEGTGSLVLDHEQRVAYACRSPRTHETLVREWCRLMQYQPVLFDADDDKGQPYYHTNVLMWIGTRCAAVCAESIGAQDRSAVMSRLRASHRQVVELTRAQVRQFAGNMLELASWDEAMGDYSVLLMSQAARLSLTGAQWQLLSGAVDSILCVPVPTIERVGGGSVRCMVAEVPRNATGSLGSVGV